MSETNIPHPPRVIITINDKSCGKTLLQQLIGDVCLRSGHTIEFLQSDPQRYLEPYGPAKSVPLATTSEMLDDAAADVERHEQLLLAVKALPEKPHHIVAYDTGASTSERIMNVMNIIRFDDRVRTACTRILVMIPVTGREDIVEAAADAVTRVRTALPGAEIMIVVSQRDGDTSRLDKKHALWRVVSQADRCLHLPKVSQDMLIRMRESRRPLHELADPEGPVSTEMLARELNLTEARTELMRATAAALVNAMDGAATDLSFPLGA